MTQKKTNGNPLLDAWIDGQEQFFNAQKEWLKSNSQHVEEVEKSETFTQAKEHWSKYEEQYNSWMKTTENWFPSFSNFTSPNDDITIETVKQMLDPSNFLKSGLDEINQAFYKLVDAPEFADIGIFEKKFLKTGKDWLEMRKATTEYMNITSEAWSQAFETYSEDIIQKPITENDSPRDLLDRWLKIANQQLIETQRSKAFLDAQRNMINTSTQYRLKQREYVESWCESVSIPTRTEVDDLHQAMYQLRREVRALKRQLNTKSSEHKSDDQKTYINNKNSSNKVNGTSINGSKQ